METVSNIFGRSLLTNAGINILRWNISLDISVLVKAHSYVILTKHLAVNTQYITIRVIYIHTIWVWRADNSIYETVHLTISIDAGKKRLLGWDLVNVKALAFYPHNVCVYIYIYKILYCVKYLSILWPLTLPVPISYIFKSNVILHFCLLYYISSYLTCIPDTVYAVDGYHICHLSEFQRQNLQLGRHQHPPENSFQKKDNIHSLNLCFQIITWHHL